MVRSQRRGADRIPKCRRPIRRPRRSACPHPIPRRSTPSGRGGVPAWGMFSIEMTDSHDPPFLARWTPRKRPRGGEYLEGGLGMKFRSAVERMRHRLVPGKWMPRMRRTFCRLPGRRSKNFRMLRIPEADAVCLLGADFESRTPGISQGP
jgi:hypothetical protein